MFTCSTVGCDNEAKVSDKCFACYKRERDAKEGVASPPPEASKKRGRKPKAEAPKPDLKLEVEPNKKRAYKRRERKEDKPPEAEDIGPLSLTLDFTKYQKAYRCLCERAMNDFRTPEMELLKLIHESLEDIEMKNP